MSAPEAPLLSAMTDDSLVEKYSWGEKDHFRLNMIFDESASHQGNDGTSETLTTKQDRRLLRLIRRDVDALIIGGRSVRAEGWHLPPRGTLHVFTSSDDLPWETCPDRSRVSLVSSPLALSHILRNLRGRVLCEGGIELARLIDERRGFDSVALTTLGRHHVTPRELQLDSSPFIVEFEARELEPLTTFTLWRRAAHGGFQTKD